MRILLLLALLALLAASSAEAFRPRGSGPIPSAALGIAVPAPAAAAGFTTLALNADFTQTLPANWLGGCAVAGNGSPNNISDNTGHTWYLNYWWSSTYQNCNTAKVPIRSSAARCSIFHGRPTVQMVSRVRSSSSATGTTIPECQARRTISRRTPIMK